MVKLSRNILHLLCTGLLMVMAGLAGAQSAASYPSKPVRIIVPTVPGGVSDAMARLLSDRFLKGMGQNFIVDNRGGGEGIIGTAAVARAAPDGYTLLVTSDAFLVNHWLRTNLPYDSFKDFKLISPLTRAESLLVVHPSVAVSNLKDFIAYARANPGKLNLASGSVGGDMKNYRFMNQAGAKLTNVNYKGAGPAMVDLLGGNVQVGLFSVAVVTQQIKAGKLRFQVTCAIPRFPTWRHLPKAA
jgi:tripartite-type tricarboxylate transporter receptor subunit TctC